MQSFSVTLDSLSSEAFAADEKEPRRSLLAKRTFDVVGAILILVIFSPLLLLIALGVFCSGGNVFFAHKRVGKGGKECRCFKFRTMRLDAAERLQKLLENDGAAREEWYRGFKLRKDPRITRMGSILRRTSLDELPQLLNVLNGDMRLVGPRPVVRDELPLYGRYARYYLASRPGMTGLWQVSGRSNTSYRRRVALDYAYVKHRSLWLDVKILLKTIVVVIGSRHGAY